MMSTKMTLTVIGAGVAVAAGIAVAVPAVAQGVASVSAGQVEVAGGGYGHGAQADDSEDRRGGAAAGEHGTGDCDQEGTGSAAAGQGMGNGMGNGSENGTDAGGEHANEDCDTCAAEPGSGDLAALGEDGIADLVTWVEEEKVAFDLYTAFGDMYDARQFDRIAASEASHMAAVRTLLTTYGLDDPTVGAVAGVFDNPDLQALYDTLYAQGSESESAALEVGVAVEQDDIQLIEKALGDVTATDVVDVLNNQLAASQRHLAAFSR